MRINWTEIAGLMAFAPAAIASTAAAATTPKLQRFKRRWWTVVAGVHAILTFEILTNNRFAMGNAIRGVLRNAGVYQERRPFQAAVDGCIGIIALFAVWRLARSAPDSWSALACGTTAVAFAIFVAETVSLHSVDTFFYKSLGPILFIGWMWLACGATTGFAAFRSASAYSSNNGEPQRARGT